jgi:hypothetical protein
LKLVVLAETCRDGTCPTIYRKDDRTVVVQGYVVEEPDVASGPGEAVVEVPAELLAQAVSALQREQK